MLTSSFERERPVLPNGILVALFAIFTELMVFAGLISAFLVIRSQIIPWPPAGQPRLPRDLSWLNTVVLLGSGVAAWQAFFKLQKKSENGFVGFSKISIALGAAFLILQGFEWARLIHFGFSMGLNLYSSFFYSIIGFHALHALVGMGLLIFGFLRRQHFEAIIYFWTFVVLLWPVLFRLVYGA